jgi:ketosteroid isomerase-like protein
MPAGVIALAFIAVFLLDFNCAPAVYDGIRDSPDPYPSKEIAMMRSFAFHATVGICALMCCAAAQSAQAQSKDDEQIRALEDKFAAAFNAEDVDAIMKLYLPGSELFVFDLGVPRQHVRWEDYKKDWQGFFAMMKGPVHFEIHDLAIVSDGKIAYSHSIQHVSWTTVNGVPMEYAVRVTDDYRKIDGEWLIAQEHVSVPIDFSGPKPEPAMNATP